MSLEKVIFRRVAVAEGRAAVPRAKAKIIETFGVEIIADELAVAPANVNGQPAPAHGGIKTVPFASTLRHIA